VERGSEEGKMGQGREKNCKVKGEYKDKGLHSGKGGKIVKNRKQAIAIALSEAGVAKPKAKK